MVFDEAAVLSMGESNAEQRTDDEEDSIPRTMCSEEPDTPSGESPLRESRQHSGSTEDERDMHSGETPRPRYNLRSTAAPQQCVPSPRYNLRSAGASGDGWTAGSAAAIKSASSPTVQEPVSYKQALRSPQSGEWEAAIKSEYDSLVSRKTWTLVPCPAGRKLVDSKWVFKLKRDANGQIARYKARLVARGFTQEKGVDYHETFAPTVRVISIRTLLALAAYNDWEVEQLDVVTAFLEADIEEEIYMRQPEGFRHFDINGEERVCLLKKSLYGLKQAPRNWNKTITAWLEEYGFTQSKVDPGIYVFIKEGELYVLALYVDDSIIVGPAGSFIVGFKSAFGERFNVQDLGPVSWLLGMTVERDRGSRTIRIGQQQYVLDMLERFNMMGCKPVGSPMAVDALSNCVETSTSRLPPGLVPYQSLIGSLLYASVSTRPTSPWLLATLVGTCPTPLSHIGSKPRGCFATSRGPQIRC